jgi:hypothetical protein
MGKNGDDMISGICIVCLVPVFLDFKVHSMNLPTRRVSGKLLGLFMVSVPACVNDFYQMTVPWNDHDMLFLSCRLERPQEVTKFYSDREFEMLIKVS